VRALRGGARGKATVSDEAEAAEAEAAPASATQAIDRAKWIVFGIVGVLSLVADQATKLWARNSLPTMPHDCGVQAIVDRRCQGLPVTVIDGFWDWRLSMNPGSAFGFLASSPAFGRWFFTLVGIGAVIGMVYMLRKARSDQKVLHWALGLVIGGALGNLIDRVGFGVVTDFVLWHYQTHEWPVFNVADVTLVAGVGLMFIDIHKENKRTGKTDKKKSRRDRAEKAKAAGLVKDFDKRE
jgi:signal peptidase II